jgi:thymidylate synthase
MTTPLCVSACNISLAWGKVFCHLMDPGLSERHPAIVTIGPLDNGASIEDTRIRELIDRELRNHHESSCGTVANTIFPRSLWNPSAKDNADTLYKRYDKAWEGIKKCPANRNGVYFRRLTCYQPKDRAATPVNQLKFISETFARGNHRRSALQASILDPTRDHSNHRQKGFPCLQQVSFTPLRNGKLSVTGFYATQYQFEKAYGNYVGLYWLGRFMAAQMNLTLTQVVCVASVLERGVPTKAALSRGSRALFGH